MIVLRAFFGHHRAATTWIRTILHDAATALNLSICTIHNETNWTGYASVGDKVRAEQPDLLVLTNARHDDVATLPELRGFHVVRDPRDIVVSGYFSHRYSHPESFGGVVWQELGPHRQALEQLDHDRGMLAEIEFSAGFLQPLADWEYGQRSDVIELRMEDLITDPVGQWTAILTHLDLLSAPGDGGEWGARVAATWNLAQRRKAPRVLALARRALPAVGLNRLPRAYVASTLDRFSFTRLTSGRKRGEEDPTHHYRRGIPGDWRNHLTEAHLTEFRVRYGTLVERLGYEW
jgi:hypothetical protein